MKTDDVRVVIVCKHCGKEIYEAQYGKLGSPFWKHRDSDGEFCDLKAIPVPSRGWWWNDD